MGKNIKILKKKILFNINDSFNMNIKLRFPIQRLLNTNQG